MKSAWRSQWQVGRWRHTSFEKTMQNSSGIALSNAVTDLSEAEELGILARRDCLSPEVGTRINEAARRRDQASGGRQSPDSWPFVFEKNQGVDTPRSPLLFPLSRLFENLSRHCLLVMAFLLTGCSAGSINDLASSVSSAESLERTTEKGPVKLTVKVTPQEPRLSDLVEMEVLVTAQQGVEIKPPAFGQAVGDFLVRDYTEKTDSKSSSAETNTRRFVYKLEPVHAGRHLIRSLAIEFVDNRPLSEQKGISSEIESEPLEVNVTSELGDEVPNLADLEPMLPPRALSETSQWGRYVVGLAILAIAVIAVWLLRRKKQKVVEPRRLTPEEIAHAAFAELLAENLPGKGQFKEFYLRLTGIVRHYIEGTTGLRAPEQTTEEFLRAMRLRDIFTAERSLRLKDFLEAADMVKYAGQQPDTEQIELSIARAREFVHFQNSATSSPRSQSGKSESTVLSSAGGD